MSFFWSFGSTKKEPTGPQPGASPAPDQHHPTFKTMSTQFRKGVQYNMKIVVRGDVMTGKSTLFHRLQGAEFNEAYNSTPEIEVANIPWQYKDSNDIIKIEVWDVVDTAHNKTKADTGIKLDHTVAPKPQDDPAMDLGLDASTVNVYRNSHAALFLFDITKQWTFDYVNNELPNVPEGMAVLVLGNFSDKSAERVVSLEEIHATLYQHNQERIEKGAIKPNLIRYAEASMKTGLGLQYIYDYFGVPFLQLQMETFKKQLELKAEEIVDTLETLDMNDKVPDIMQRRRGQDNFDQPSEPHLARQREEMKNAWEQELEEIAAESPALEVPSPSFVRKETPPPPTAPVRGRRREGSLVSDSERMPAAVDQFDAGELADDWFGDDAAAPATSLSKRQDSDNEDYNGNPMVAGDEDVESVEYYNTGKESVVAVAPIQEPTVKQESEEEEEEVYSPKIQTNVFKSELGNVWDSTSDNPYLQRQTRVESDSEDEDNTFSPNNATEEDLSHFTQVSSPFTGGFGGYEEIGGDNDNPWSYDDKKKKEQEQFWADTENDQPQTQVGDEPVDRPEVQPVDKGKKKAVSSSGTKKKKSRDGKKKKKKSA